MKARDVMETYYGRFEGCLMRQTYILVQLLDRIHSDHPAAYRVRMWGAGGLGPETSWIYDGSWVQFQGA